MTIFDSLQASSSGMSAQRLRMNLISKNLANIDTTRTPEGGPYRRKEAHFASKESDGSFQNILETRILEDTRPPILKYDPSHPDADLRGYLRMPNINVIEEMANMISASRNFEANVTAVKTAKHMAGRAIDIGR